MTFWEHRGAARAALVQALDAALRGPLARGRMVDLDALVADLWAAHAEPADPRAADDLAALPQAAVDELVAGVLRSLTREDDAAAAWARAAAAAAPTPERQMRRLLALCDARPPFPSFQRVLDLLVSAQLAAAAATGRARAVLLATVDDAARCYQAQLPFVPLSDNERDALLQAPYRIDRFRPGNGGWPNPPQRVSTTPASTWEEARAAVANTPLAQDEHFQVFDARGVHVLAARPGRVEDMTGVDWWVVQRRGEARAAELVRAAAARGARLQRWRASGEVRRARLCVVCHAKTTLSVQFPGDEADGLACCRRCFTAFQEAT
ncbi:MAG TPA: hypothetical protein VF897_05580 [Roseiflexaceae bacterium]